MSTLKVSLLQMDCRIADPEYNFLTARSYLEMAAHDKADLAVLPGTVGLLLRAGPGGGVRRSAGRRADPRQCLWPLCGTGPGHEPDRGRFAARTRGRRDLQHDGRLRPRGTAAVLLPQGTSRTHAAGGGVPGGGGCPVNRGPRRTRSRPGHLLRPAVPGTVPDLHAPRVAACRLCRPSGRICAAPTGRPWCAARAIENQTYMVACNGVGEFDNIRFCGHSAVVDPWGEVLVDAGTVPGVYTVECDLGSVDGIRQAVPVLATRRPEVYARAEEQAAGGSAGRRCGLTTVQGCRPDRHGSGSVCLRFPRLAEQFPAAPLALLAFLVDHLHLEGDLAAAQALHGAQLAYGQARADGVVDEDRSPETASPDP